MKKTTRLTSSPLRLERHTLRNLHGGDGFEIDLDTVDWLTLPLPRPSRGPVTSILEPGPTSITCPPTKVGGGG